MAFNLTSNGHKTIMKPSDLMAATNDVEGPKKWYPPAPTDHSQPWLKDDPSAYTVLLDENVKKFPEKFALSWVDDNGKITQRFTYKQVGNTFWFYP